ncbi:MAG TPA: DUF4921 family protein [Candidatus Paceibacterota bacterium]|nr:DUF4921 family protein [Candidatus Paceibacterota bacterium]
MALSEFRQDLVSGEWVLFATGRAKRPRPEPLAYAKQPKELCPFEDIEKSEQELIWRSPNSSDWQIAVLRNKYPAVGQGECGPDQKVGPYTVHSAIGEHDLFVFRNHDLQLHNFTPEQMLPVVKAYKLRKRELTRIGGCIKYVMLFHNFGIEAGASISHSHSQILAMPILPPSVDRSIQGAFRFYKEHQKKAYLLMIIWEKEQGHRIVYENDYFIAFCPFASRHPGEIRIFPKSGDSHFIQTPEELDSYFAEALSVVLHKMKNALHEPAYNFYFHTAPTELNLGDIHDYYSWHIEIVPKLQTEAGFELGTGVDINTVDPDEMARMLREAPGI